MNISLAHSTAQHSTARNYGVGSTQKQQVSFGVKLRTEDILQTTTGIILREGGIDGIYKVCDAMAGEGHFTHELPGVGKKCTESLVKQFPKLKTINKRAKKFFNDPKRKNKRRSLEAITEWTNKMVKKLGNKKELDVKPLATDYYDHSLLEGKKVIGIVF